MQLLRFPGKILWLSLVLLCTMSIAAFSLQKGQKLSSLHTELLAEGWRPVETNLKFDDGSLQHFFGDAGALFKAGYTEVESCTGTGVSRCFFNYTKAGKCLQVITEGEYLPDRHAEPTIVLWSENCPGSQ